jgi:peptidoglycan/xylan/chitin deacetylase (PgdA/CDA1 family)
MKAYIRTLVRRAACLRRPRCLVLTYHHVWNPRETAPWITVSPDEFAEQMAFLSGQRLVVPLDVLMSDLRRGRCTGGGRVVVTIDDASADVYGVIYPILRRYGVPATVFVPTGLVGTARPFWWNRLYALGRAAEFRGVNFRPVLGRACPGLADDMPLDVLWRPLRVLPSSRREELLDACVEALGFSPAIDSPGPMNWEQIDHLDRSGLITLGAHTVTHPMLGVLSPDEAASEIVGSRDALAKYTSFRNVFAYPYGDPPVVTDQVKKIVREAGFEAAFTTEPRSLRGSEDRMALGRVCIDGLRLAEFQYVIDHYLRC